MIEIQRKRLIFKIREIWFSDEPYDVSGADRVIFQDCRNKVDLVGFKRVEFHTYTIDLSKDLDALKKNMTPNCRYDIDRGYRDGIKLVSNDFYCEFRNLVQKFRTTKGLPPHEITADFMKANGVLFTSHHLGHFLGGMFFLKGERTLRYFIGASERLNAEAELTRAIGRSNRMMVWEGVKWAKSQGLEELDLGGICSGENLKEENVGINGFKKRFGGELRTHYIYEKSYSAAYKTSDLLRKFLGIHHA